MKKYLIGGVVAAAFIAYAIFANNNNNQPITPVAPTATSTGTPNTNGPTSTIPATTPPAGNPPGTPVNTPATTTTPTGQYKDGTYTGAVADAFYGNLQVIAVDPGWHDHGRSHSRKHPSGGHSGEVSAFALPPAAAGGDRRAERERQRRFRRHAGFQGLPAIARVGARTGKD